MTVSFRKTWATVVLLIAVLGTPAFAHFIDTSDPAYRLRVSTASPAELQKITGPLFEFAPFRPHANNRVPALLDPLGMGTDPSLKLYSGLLFNSDLLGYFHSLRTDNNNDDLELPQGTVHQSVLVSNYVSRFFGGKVRAADRSLNRLRKAGKRTWLGLPTTLETSPLTLAGFGSVGEVIRPVRRNWLDCDGVERRIHVMTDVPPNLRRKLPPSPSFCYEI